MHVWKMFFRAPQQHRFHKSKTVHAKLLLLLIYAIPPKRDCDFANQLGSIAQICKSSDFASEVLRFSNSLFRGAVKTTNSENAIPLGPNAWLSMDLQYLLYDLGDSYVSSVTSRVLPTSGMAILVKTCCRNRDSAVSSSGRLPAPFRGLWACLRAFF